MPIPIRIHSASTANKAGEALPPNPDPQPAPQTRLTDNGSKPRTQSKPSATTTRPAREPRPGIPRGTPVAGHGRNLSTASIRKGPTKGVTANVSHIATPKPDVTSTSKLLHSRTLSASAKSDIRGRTLLEGTAKSTRPVSKGTTALDDQPTLKKPEFNTYKQHFSPKKTKQFPSPALAFTRSQDGGGGTSSGEDSAKSRHLQDELLQLTLLHETVETTLQAYQKNIATQLVAWSDDLKQQLEALASLEGENQSKANVHAATTWLDPGKEQPTITSTASNKLLVLAHSIRELTEITQQGGPLDAAMRQFEEWQISATSTSLKGTNRGTTDGTSRSLLAPPDPRWPAWLTSVQKRVQTCADSLADLQGPNDLSSISLLIYTHSRLADQVLQEITICREIQSLILRREEQWKDAAITRALSDVEWDDSGQVRSCARRKGIWDLHEADRRSNQGDS